MSRSLFALVFAVGSRIGSLGLIVLLAMVVPYVRGDETADAIKAKIQKATVNPWTKGQITLVESQERSGKRARSIRVYTTIGADGVSKSLTQTLFTDQEDRDWRATWEYGWVSNYLKIGDDRFEVFPHSKVVIKKAPTEVPKDLQAMQVEVQKAFRTEDVEGLKRFTPSYTQEYVELGGSRLLKITATAPKAYIDAYAQVVHAIAKTRLSGKEPLSPKVRKAFKQMLSEKATRATVSAKVEIWIDETRCFVRRKVSYNEVGDILEQEECTNVVRDYRSTEELFAFPKDYRLVIETVQRDWKLSGKFMKEEYRILTALRKSRTLPATTQPTSNNTK